MSCTQSTVRPKSLTKYDLLPWLPVEVGQPEAHDAGPCRQEHPSRRRPVRRRGEVQAVRIDRRPPRRAQRVVSRTRKGSASRRKKVNVLRREWERTRIRERNAPHGISASIVKSRNRIAIEDLQVSNMMRNPNLARSIAEQQWARLAEQTTCRLPAPVRTWCGSTPVTRARTAMPAGTAHVAPCARVCPRRLRSGDGPRCQRGTEHSPARDRAGRAGHRPLGSSRRVRGCS